MRQVSNNPQQQLPSGAQLLFIAIALAASVNLSFGQIPCSYEVAHIIQAPDCKQFGQPDTFALGMSPNGRYVCGFYHPCVIGDQRAFVYDTQTSQFVTLPLGPGFSTAWAADVNNDGIVCGSGEKTGTGQRAFVYHLDTDQWIELPSVNPDAGWSNANAINSSGAVCGSRSIGPAVNPQNAFFWTPDNGFVDLGVMNGPNSTALDINDERQVVGFTGGSPISTTPRAFVHYDGRTDIFGVAPNAVNSLATKTDNEGRILVVGNTQLSPILNVAYSYENGDFNQLIPLPGPPTLQVRGINNNNVAVGNSGSPAMGMIPTIWFNGIPTSINDLAVLPADMVIEYGRLISDDGVIVVHAEFDGDDVAVLLLPVPRTPGDTNCDQSVNVDDLLTVINSWGPCRETCEADFTIDGVVNVSDLVVVLDNWSV